ncbi:MAG TPA: acetyl-CoA hydrolase/transferase C-terminal domain-containing protein [Deltaproteobacteria bacterium]|jgi:butyryl-CoA:acetate CoA-transferase|nr:butyryl-CoA:acetate CoA-transferase [Deltaproteobacteria bacterium]HRW79321.1 acetyl-CoA hydrolase/transferase C-terminal domain-containing protein [Desulfomonilia bacterium]HNQ84823.1 acetyl-CoA hydrolase/transferase C-terminal domain-containing protein [Deltaproteobacteria bacterium]HNS89628.1 acetyl-CoA hydrolase/transferase C-terminal domain-containing protein [Deltaproteobacteria bacterium]HOC75297.1 acetyl-CoA hydrolase/transferase C-terminal domain-containing protein [Deltaproteobacte
MNDFTRMKYIQKLRTADQVAGMVSSGDRIFFGEFVLRPDTLDEALARRAKQLSNVIIEGVCITTVPRFIEADPCREHFIYHDWHFSGVGRKLYQQGLCSYVPFTYHQGPRVVRKYKDYDFVFVTARPMDSQGYFNFGLCNSLTSAAITKGKRVIVEVNESLPHCLGGNQESVHISRVDYVVQGRNLPLLEVKPAVPADTDVRIARHIMNEIEDGACLQLGIGGLPNVIGSMIADSDLKDLGIHTEMLVDSMVDLYNEGKITGNCKTIDRFKMVYTFAMGTNKLYEFLHNNPACASYPVNYTNDPRIIAVNNKVVAINNAIEVDLFGQVCSESAGTAHISGTGGQFDFIFGAFNSRGGKGIIGISSTFTDRDGNVHSRIVPTLRPGAIVTVPRSAVQYVATEFGIVQLKGKSTWERAEALIGVAHPMFRDELVRQAEDMKIWLDRNRYDALDAAAAF